MRYWLAYLLFVLSIAATYFGFSRVEMEYRIVVLGVATVLAGKVIVYLAYRQGIKDMEDDIFFTVDQLHLGEKYEFIEGWDTDAGRVVYVLEDSEGWDLWLLPFPELPDHFHTELDENGHIKVVPDEVPVSAR